MTLETLSGLWLRATPEQRRQIGAAVEGTLTGAAQGAVIARLVKRPEAAKLLTVTVSRIDQLCRAGVLEKVCAPGTRKAIGITEASLRQLTTGGKVVV
ncbi:MAG: hypothetical protein WCP12_09555 [bacterium]